jgi:hypothetical protein
VSKTKVTPAAVPDESDEHAGKGGSYVIGADGKRVLQERTLSREEAEKAEQNTEVSDVAANS